MKLINLSDVEEAARAVLPAASYDYIAGGAGDEVSLARPRAIFDRIRLRPRVLVDVSGCDTGTTLLGHRVPAPILVAPSGDHGIAHADAERATARGAAAAGTIMIASCGSTLALEEIAAAAADGARWLHLPLFKDRGVAAEIVRRAQASGYSALCLTVDHKVAALRERNVRNGWVSPPTANLSGLLDVATADWADGRSARQRAEQVFDRGATWAYLTELTGMTDLPIVVKGVLRSDDARRAVEEGAAAIVVSDHGGRQLDTTFSPIEVLPEIADAVDASAEVYLDGGIRRGTDVLKALALGARAVLLGRPVMYGLAVAGAEGVRTVLSMLADELATAMAMCGAPRLDAIDASLLGWDSPLERRLRSAT
jgi:4-hydroxymandelate oxidase